MDKFLIKINGIEMYGLVTFQIQQVENGIRRVGLLKTHKYIEEIDSIECKRFRIEGIEVYAESFGSTDEFILYQFIYETYEVLDYEIEESKLLDLYEKEVIE